MFCERLFGAADVDDAAGVLWLSVGDRRLEEDMLAWSGEEGR